MMNVYLACIGFLSKSWCIHVVGDKSKGKHYKCGSQVIRQQNLEKILTDREKEQITASTLKQKFATANPEVHSLK